MRVVRELKKIAIVAGLALAAAPLPVLADAVTDQAKGLIEQGKGVEAYRMLDILESERAGDPVYDLLLGISALDAGQGTRAIFALERVLAVDPNNVRARAEIARAYMLVGETETAKAEFETTKKQGVPPEVAATIDKLVVAIDRMADAGRSSIKGYIEGIVGHDSNANAAPSRSTVAVPVLGGLPFTLDSDSRKRSDWFGTLGGGISIRHPVSPGVVLLGGLSGSQRWNFDHTDLDTASIDAYGGVLLNQGRNVYSITAQSSTLFVDDEDFRRANGVTGLWQHNLDSRNQLSAFAQYSNLSYLTQSVRDADRYVLGGAWAHAFREGQVAFLSAYLANERPEKSNVEHLGHHAYGLRAGGQWGLDAKFSLFGSVAFEHRRYGGEDPSFLKRRSDDQLNLNLGVTYLVTKELSVTPQISLTDNQSNVHFNDYRRDIVSVTVRREF